MKRIAIAAAVAALALGGCFRDPHQQAGPEAGVQTDSYMRQAEEDWAALAVRRIPGLLDRILADDYVGVSSKGDIRNKAQQKALDAKGPDGTYTASHLDYVRYRHFGDTVIAQGGETLTRRDGGLEKSLIWTDVWMFRGGEWQIVASQDSVLPEKK